MSELEELITKKISEMEQIITEIKLILNKNNTPKKTISDDDQTILDMLEEPNTDQDVKEISRYSKTEWFWLVGLPALVYLILLLLYLFIWK